MAITYKVLGQETTTAGGTASLYTVPSSTSTIVSTLVVANRASTSGTYRIAVRPANATLVDKHYLVYDASLDGNTSIALTLGITLATTDVITVVASTANFSFSAFGSEVTV